MLQTKALEERVGMVRPARVECPEGRRWHRRVSENSLGSCLRPFEAAYEYIRSSGVGVMAVKCQLVGTAVIGAPGTADSLGAYSCRLNALSMFQCGHGPREKGVL